MKSNVKGNVTKAKRGQHGGTVLGIVIGLVIGLTIAVVVAMMITKTSTPFTNKLGITKADGPAMQLTDPNKPLYGSSAKEIMANANRPAETSVDNVIPGSQPVVHQVPDAVKSEVKADSKVVKTVDTAPVKSEAEEKSPSYYLQVGAFRDAGDAEGARAKLALIGVEAHVSNTENDNLYRVRIGPFDQLDNMNRMRSKLTENSIDVAVIKTPK